jgi:hypothetical protein
VVALAAREVLLLVPMALAGRIEQAVELGRGILLLGRPPCFAVTVAVLSTKVVVACFGLVLVEVPDVREGFGTVREDADVVLVAAVPVRVCDLVVPVVDLGGGFSEMEEAGRFRRVDAGVLILRRVSITEADRALPVGFFVVTVDTGIVTLDRRFIAETDRVLPAGFFTLDARVT